MIFFISRTSSNDEEEPPCKEAFLDGKEWKIEVPDLEALMKFIGEHGRVIIYGGSEIRASITIYDDYVE